MNKILKTKKGITLVALVITIIILLILAGITISQLSGSGLFENARLAEQKSKNAQEKEESILGDYKNKLVQYVDGSRETVTINKEEYEAIKSNLESLNKKVENIGQTIKSSGSVTTASNDKVTLTSVTLPAGKWMILFNFRVEAQVSTENFFQMRYNVTNALEQFPTYPIINRSYQQKNGHVFNESMAYVSGEQEMTVDFGVNNYTGNSYTMLGEIIAIRIQ